MIKLNETRQKQKSSHSLYNFNDFSVRSKVHKVFNQKVVHSIALYLHNVRFCRLVYVNENYDESVLPLLDL